MQKAKEEFFNTFNELKNKNCQIVMTNDRPPKFLKGFEERLTSRFESGTTADITPPDLETKIAIIKRKCEDNSIIISKDIIEVQTEFLDDAEEAVVSFGGTARTAYQAVLNARANGKKVGFIRLVTIWPFADNFFANLPANIKKLVVAELNYGQIFYEVQRTFKGEVELCAKYDMTIFEPSEIEAFLGIRD